MLRLVQVQRAAETALIHVGEACALIPGKIRAVVPVGFIVGIAVEMIEGAEGDIIRRAAIVDDIDREIQLFQLFRRQIGRRPTVRELVVNLIMLVILFRCADVGNGSVVDMVVVREVVVLAVVNGDGDFRVVVVGLGALIIGAAIEDDVGIRRKVADKSTQVHADIIGEIIAFNLDKVSVFIHHPDGARRAVLRLVRYPVRLVDKGFHILVGQKEAATVSDDIVVISLLGHRGIYRAAILCRKLLEPRQGNGSIHTRGDLDGGRRNPADRSFLPLFIIRHGIILANLVDKGRAAIFIGQTDKTGVPFASRHNADYLPIGLRRMLHNLSPQTRRSIIYHIPKLIKRLLRDMPSGYASICGTPAIPMRQRSKSLEIITQFLLHPSNAFGGFQQPQH